jgi:hypothetical protein
MYRDGESAWMPSREDASESRGSGFWIMCVNVRHDWLGKSSRHLKEVDMSDNGIFGII